MNNRAAASDNRLDSRKVVCGASRSIVLFSCIAFLVYQNLTENSDLSTYRISTGQPGAKYAWEFEESFSSPVRNISVGFVHVGETGSRLVSRFLKNGCHSFLPKPCGHYTKNDAVLASLVEGYYNEPDAKLLPQSKHEAYVVNFRDVFDRSVAAFWNNHPRNAPRNAQSHKYDCFSSLEEFATYLGDDPFHYTYPDPKVLDDSSCPHLAKAAIDGGVSAFGGLRHNYDFVLQSLPEKRTVYALRAEHLWDDWEVINELLGQPVDKSSRPNITRSQNSLSSGLSVGYDLSEAGRDRLCKALEPEYRAYFTLLKKSINIKSQDLLEAQQRATQNCPNMDLNRLAQKQKRPPKPNQGIVPTFARKNPPPSGVAFVHIGKTGGSTISQLLPNGCHSFVPKPCPRNVTPTEAVVPHMVKRYYHFPDTALIAGSRHETYIVTIRDPYDRTVSAFLYEHPENLLAFENHKGWMERRTLRTAYSCFPTLEQFTDAIGDDPANYYYPNKASVDVSSCTNLARAAINGGARIFHHLFLNTKLVHQGLIAGRREPPEIYVIRKEYLWDDWVSVNDLMGQPAGISPLPNVTKSKRNVTHISPPVSGVVSDRGSRRLCRALLPEYKAYFSLLEKAININDQDIAEARERAIRNCPSLAAGGFEAETLPRRWDWFVWKGFTANKLARGYG